MDLVIKAHEKREIERVLAIIELGLLTALESDSIGIEEAEGYLFNPYTMRKMQECNVSSELIDIVHLGSELEDIQSLMPDKLKENILSLKEKCIDVLNKLEEPDIPTSKLIQEIHP
ncbi:DUF3969 family protein [Abyssisolibacter fermentans]|uniref:DUF3969 family protein n=1 Tax=Abyssisolibacter fermentans TaxID=1766203 RepID=UPI000832F5A8|nr:DUF3969 family protein [Abyssisolibacter fermentans]